MSEDRPDLRLPADPAGRRAFLRWLAAGVPLVALPLGAAVPAGCSTVAGTGRRQLILIPDAQMAALSDQAWAEVAASERACTHQPTVALVERVATGLAAHAPKRGNGYLVTTLESDTVNAFALPNGRIAVYTGLLPYCANEAAVAAVIGHEIAHIVARHGSERMSQQLASNIAIQLAAFGLSATDLDPQNQQLAVAALGAGSTVGLLLPFSRKHEYEADRLGLQYMSAAGYDPREAVRFWQRFADMGTSKPPEFFSTHPSDGNRIAAIEQRMDDYLALYRAAPQQHGAGAAIPEPYAG